MDRIPSGSAPNIKYVGDSRLSSALRKANCFINPAAGSDDKTVIKQTAVNNRPLRRKQTFDILREKPSMTLRLAKSKAALRKKASELFRRGRLDEADNCPRLRWSVLLISAPEDVAVQQGPFEVGHPSYQINRKTEIATKDVDAVSQTSSDTIRATPRVPAEQTPAIVDEAEIAAVTTLLPLSPPLSWTATPASKIGSKMVSKQRYRSLAYDPTGKVEFIAEGAEAAKEASFEAQSPALRALDFYAAIQKAAEDRAKEAQAWKNIADDGESDLSSLSFKLKTDDIKAAANAANGHANITASREWSSGDEDEQVQSGVDTSEEAKSNSSFFKPDLVRHQAKTPVYVGDKHYIPRLRPARPATPEVSSAIFLTAPNSDAFNEALVRQREAAGSDAPNANESIGTVTLHSATVFLHPAMEVNASSTVPSSDKKATAPSVTATQIEQLVGTLEAKRNALSAENKEMKAALVFASSQATEYRAFIEQLRRSKYKQEQKLSTQIRDLRAGIQDRDRHMQNMQDLLAVKEELVEFLQETIQNMVGPGSKVLQGEEAVEQLQSI